ncbi:MAG TPA: NADH-quinone oxidoreductase subunit C [Bacteroidota bacterium]|nr:NADH-quinone oxidoreductase subunit C [Bacteroidota bacterium]
MNQRVVDRLRELVPGAVSSVAEFRGDTTVTVRREDLVRVARTLRDDADLAFDMIIDLLGVDMYRPEDRFEVVYNLYSLKNKEYLRLKVLVDEQDLAVPTVTGVWPGANWHERETYDMFGVVFTGHPDLRRLYLPEEFEYYPLRKDFPTMGIPDSLPLPRR